jgi:hypothetical protein
MDSVISRLIIRDTHIMSSHDSIAVAAVSLSAAFGWATANAHLRMFATMKIDRCNFAKISRAADRLLVANSDSSSIDRYAG